MWTSPTRLTRFQSGKRNAKGNLLAAKLKSGGQEHDEADDLR